jgi:HAD superfamily hydrolase (TIGR01490 family)
MRLALFDLDGTLLPGDSDHAWGEFVIARGWADATAHRAGNDAFYADYASGRLDIAAYTDFATAPWRDRPAAELAAARADFIAQAIQPQLHPAALALVQRHREAGDLLAIVTATNDFVTRPIADLFGVDALIATELARDASGRVTGAVQGTPSFREGKIARVADWLAGRGLALPHFQSSTFYSDSPNDLPLLERVSHPVATNPTPALAQTARQRGWPVLNLFA